MTDLIIKGTGNSRTLKTVSTAKTTYPTYDKFIEALIAGSFPIDIGKLQSTGVQTAGTGFTKANMLKDATAAMYGLTSTAVPDDVLAKIPTVSNAGWKILKEWTTAGTYTWTVPNLFSGSSYEIGVLVIGGGGSGGVTGSYNFSAKGGLNGSSIYFLKQVSPNQTYSVVVGAGGSSVQAQTGSNTGAEGNNGGSSSFAGITADGGLGGTYGGGNYSSSFYIQEGGLYFIDRVDLGNPIYFFNPFECCRILSPGAGAGSTLRVKNPVTGKGGGTGATGTGGTVRAGNADAPGCGGGAAKINYGQTGATSGTIISGTGAAGAVKIYVMGVVT